MIKRLRAGIRGKLIVLMSMIIICTAVVSMSVVYYYGVNVMSREAEKEHMYAIVHIAASISDIVSNEVKDIEIYAESPLWKGFMVEANAQYGHMNSEAINELLLSRDKEWNERTDESAQIRQYMGNMLARRLKKLADDDDSIGEIFITDREGGIVASSGRTTDFYQADEEWWQKAYNEGRGGIYIGDVEYDESARLFGMVIALPCYDDNGVIIGICKAVININDILYIIQRFNVGETGSFVLIGTDDSVLYKSRPEITMDFSEFSMKELQSINNVYAGEGFFGSEKKKVITGMEIENPFLLKNGIMWKAIFIQDKAEIIAPIMRFVVWGMAFMPAVIVIATIVVAMFSRKIIAPLEELQKASESIGRGDFNLLLTIQTGDEIELLSAAFNRMASNIKEKQRELDEARMYAENIISSMVDSLVIIGEDSIIKHVNESTCMLLGYSRDELVGKNISIIVPDSGAEWQVNKAPEEAAVHNIEMVYKTKQGEDIPVSFSAAMMRDKKDGALLGIVGVAQDMRTVVRLINSLKKAHKEVEDFSKTLEKRVDERTRDLQRSQEAALNIMEDMIEAKEDLERVNAELIKAKEENEKLMKELEEKVVERTAKLSALYTVSSAIARTLNYQELMATIMNSLLEIVHYDICAVLLFDERTVNIVIKPSSLGSDKFIDEVKENLSAVVSLFAAENIDEKKMRVLIIPTEPVTLQGEVTVLDTLQSSFDAPLIIGEKTVGMLTVSSCKANAFTDDDRNFMYTIASQIVTAIEHLQSVLIDEKSKLKAIAESMDEGVIMLDKQEEPIILNPQAKAVMNLDLSRDIGGKELKEKFKKLNIDDDLRESSNKKMAVTKEIINEDGEDLYCNISPVMDMNENVTGTTIILRSAGEQEKEESARETLKLKFQQAQKMESFGLLAGGIAHDFNNLLTGVMGNVDALLMSIPPDSPIYSCVKDIESAGEQATNLCRQMLAYSGNSKMEATIFSLSDVLQELTHLLSASISKKIEIRRDFSVDSAIVEADITQIKQVIMNLIINAADSIGDKRGVITISTGTVECDEHYFDDPSFTGKPSAGVYAYCEITDTGCGMSKEAQRKAFDPFYTTKFKGRGLGLAAVLGVINSHKGSIQVRSELGRGATFKCFFPQCDKKKISQHEDVSDVKNWKGSGTILLIDDEVLARTVGKRLLEKAGFTVLTASDGPEGIESFRTHREEISAVLLDFVMPKMNGEEVFHELVRIKDDVKVILCSGYNEQTAVSNLTATGLAGFIQKPYRNNVLMAKLRTLLT